MMLKTVRSALHGIPKTPCHGIHSPQDWTQSDLIADATTTQSGKNFVVCSLRPLKLATAWPAGATPPVRACLRFTARKTARPVSLGWLELKLDKIHPHGAVSYAVYDVIDSRENILHPLHRMFDDWATQHHAKGRSADPNNFTMSSKDFQAFCIFYLCPRPVVVVSVAHGGRSNVFPMDLIGETGAGGPFSLALRCTSPSVELIERSEVLAFGGAPIAQKEIVYRLGEHHRKPHVDWDALGIPTLTTANFGLRLPQWILTECEMKVRGFLRIGSHVVFLTERLSEHKTNSAPQMHHVNGRYLSRIRKLGNPS